MNKLIDRLRIVFLIVFAVACAAVWTYQIFWVWPQKRCEQDGKWWAPKYRTCARVVYLPKMTGRDADTKAQAVAKQKEPAAEQSAPAVKAPGSPKAPG